MGRTLLLLAAIAAALFLSGCTLSYGGSPLAGADQLKKHDQSVPKYGDPNAPPGDQNSLICKELSGNTPCACLRCENKTTWAQQLFPFLSLWFDASLAGGRCTFEQCSQDTLISQLEESTGKIQQRVFAYGMGPSFTSTDTANLYCGYSLQLATKWMVGKNTVPKIPRASRGVCWLDRNVMPVFMYYTGGKAIDSVRSEQIAMAFEKQKVNFLGAGGAGPVLLTTEVDFDSTDVDQINAVKRQILSYDKCDKCLTVLAVPNGERGTEALKQIIGTPPNFDPTYYPKVDLIGFGFRNTDYETCNLDQIIYENLKLSRDILKDYYKPSIWLYAGASEGNSLDGSCQWTAEKVHNFYQAVFELNPALASSGVLGASFYELVDGTGPLPCNPVQGCKFGLFNEDGTQKHPELNTWAETCQAFGVPGARTPVFYSRNGYGSVCEIPNAKVNLATSSEINTQQFLSDAEVAPMEKQEKLGCGEICVSDSKMQRPDIYDSAGKSFSTAHCDLYPEIDERADDADISTMYYRSIVEQETGGSFDPTLFSCVSPGNGGCNGQGLSMATICGMAGLPPDCGHAVVPSGPPECTGGQKACAFGLAQCIELPGDTSWATDGCRGPDNVYNPFDPSESVCCGINKFSKYLDMAEVFVSSNWGELAKCDGLKDGEQGWAAYLIASNYYNAGPGNVPGIGSFISQRDQGGDCSGEQNYISYISGKNNYGKEVMTRYTVAVDKCDSDCPGK